MKPFDYNKYLKNNPLLKEYKEEKKETINEFMHIPLEMAADAIGGFVSKLNKKYMDIDKKVLIAVNDTYKDLKDVRFAQFLEDVKKDFAAGKEEISKYEGLKSAGKNAIKISISGYSNNDKNDVKITVLDLDGSIQTAGLTKLLDEKIFKTIAKGKKEVKGNSIEYDLNKLYPIETKDGKETAKIANPAPELQKTAVK